MAKNDQGGLIDIHTETAIIGLLGWAKSKKRRYSRPPPGGGSGFNPRGIQGLQGIGGGMNPLQQQFNYTVSNPLLLSLATYTLWGNYCLSNIPIIGSGSNVTAVAAPDNNPSLTGVILSNGNYQAINQNATIAILSSLSSTAYTNTPLHIHYLWEDSNGQQGDLLDQWVIISGSFTKLPNPPQITLNPVTGSFPYSQYPYPGPAAVPYQFDSGSPNWSSSGYNWQYVASSGNYIYSANVSGSFVTATVENNSSGAYFTCQAYLDSNGNVPQNPLWPFRGRLIDGAFMNVSATI
jgi:hypothetical protein